MAASMSRTLRALPLSGHSLRTSDTYRGNSLIRAREQDVEVSDAMEATEATDAVSSVPAPAPCVAACCNCCSCCILKIGAALDSATCAAGGDMDPSFGGGGFGFTFPAGGTPPPFGGAPSTASTAAAALPLPLICAALC